MRDLESQCGAFFESQTRPAGNRPRDQARWRRVRNRSRRYYIHRSALPQSIPESWRTRKSIRFGEGSRKDARLIFRLAAHRHQNAVQFPKFLESQEYARPGRSQAHAISWPAGTSVGDHRRRYTDIRSVFSHADQRIRMGVLFWKHQGFDRHSAQPERLHPLRPGASSA